jgi:hypothetical protein
MTGAEVRVALAIDAQDAELATLGRWPLPSAR